MLDFLFITSPTNASNPHPPYYYLYLISYLEERGFSCKLIDPKGKDTPDAIENHISNIISELINNPARFIGLSAFHSDYDMITKLGKIIKEIQPDTNLLVGNAHATIQPEDFIYKGSFFDIAVIGEGEETCCELAKIKELNYSNLMEIKGIAFLNNFKNQWGDFEETGMIVQEYRQAIDMKSINMPSYKHIDLNYYFNPQKLIIRRLYMRMMPIFASRGCPFNCHFCSANIIWQKTKGKKYRIRTVDSVIEEIRFLINKGMDQFYLFDDMSWVDKNWTIEFINKKKELDKEFNCIIPFACQTRVEIITSELVKSLKEIGCIQIDLGVEAGSQKLLDIVNKKITKDQIRNAFKILRDNKMRSFATMLLNLPEETEEDLKETYEFIEEIKPSAGVIFGVTTPYPASEIYKYCKPPLKKEEYGLLINNRLNPIERFRMSSHNLDLEEIWEKWNRKFKATPMFERMWACNPFQKYYWLSILRSKYKMDYIKMWSKDLIKTFILYWSHKLHFYRFLKKIQYRGTKKY